MTNVESQIAAEVGEYVSTARKAQEGQQPANTSGKGKGPSNTGRGADTLTRAAHASIGQQNRLTSKEAICNGYPHMWKDSIEVNRASADASKVYAAKKFPGATRWEGLRAIDYIVYAHLQIG